MKNRLNKPLKDQKEGMQDDELYEPCMSRDHEPPMHIYIPPGKKFVHVCSGCGRVTVLRGSSVRW